jgi:hypothetical protein
MGGNATTVVATSYRKAGPLLKKYRIGYLANINL